MSDKAREGVRAFAQATPQKHLDKERRLLHTLLEHLPRLETSLKQWGDELDQVKRVVKESPDYVTLLESLVSDAQSEKEQLYALQLETDTIEQEIQRVEATIAAVEKSLGETRKKTQELSDHRRASAREATTATGNYMSTAMTLTATTSNSWVFLLFGSTVILAVLLMVTIIATATNTNSATYV